MRVHAPLAERQMKEERREIEVVYMWAGGDLTSWVVAAMVGFSGCVRTVWTAALRLVAPGTAGACVWGTTPPPNPNSRAPTNAAIAPDFGVLQLHSAPFFPPLLAIIQPRQL